MVGQPQPGDERDTQPVVSIIVACKAIDQYVLQCIDETKKLDFQSYEVIVLPDSENGLRDRGVIVIPTGPIAPSEKRNIGAEKSKGEILAFLDGDAYPARDWLKNAVRHLQDNSIVAVGGPSLTPETDEIMQKASGEIFSSYIGSGPLSLRNSKKNARKCDDLPSVNLLVRRGSFDRIGGFDSGFWPGEDTKFCRDLQGLHRGYFSKKFPENSRKITYFAPAALLLALPTSVALLFTHGILSVIALAFLGSYLSILLVSSGIVGLRQKSALLASVVFLGAIATHICYGAYFVKGLLSRNLAR